MNLNQKLLRALYTTQPDSQVPPDNECKKCFNHFIINAALRQVKSFTAAWINSVLPQNQYDVCSVRNTRRRKTVQKRCALRYGKGWKQHSCRYNTNPSLLKQQRVLPQRVLEVSPLSSKHTTQLFQLWRYTHHCSETLHCVACLLYINKSNFIFGNLHYTKIV